jgi:hypothetical protein
MNTNLSGSYARRALTLSSMLAVVALALVIDLGTAAHANTIKAASAVRTISLSDHASLRVIRKSTTVDEAHGQASGTLPGNLTVHITVDSADRMTASFTSRSRAGSLSGSGSATYRISGNILDYSGTARVSNGGGALAHAVGSLQIKGSLNRLRGSMSMTITGTLHL